VRGGGRGEERGDIPVWRGQSCTSQRWSVAEGQRPSVRCPPSPEGCTGSEQEKMGEGKDGLHKIIICANNYNNRIVVAVVLIISIIQ
jgi:hypothetical protein